MVVIVAMPNFGADAESFRAGLHDALTRMLRAQMETPDGPLKLPGGADPGTLHQFHCGDHAAHGGRPHNAQLARLICGLPAAW